MVLGVPRYLLENLGIGQGLHFNIEDYLRQLLDPSNSVFRSRAQVENDPDFKQLIPYVLIKRGNAWLHYIRGQTSGEKRLVNRGSIGIGGHINPVDGNLLKWGQPFMTLHSNANCLRKLRWMAFLKLKL